MRVLHRQRAQDQELEVAVALVRLLVSLLLEAFFVEAQSSPQ
jgi:hypothetical protein